MIALQESCELGNTESENDELEHKNMQRKLSHELGSRQIGFHGERRLTA